MAVDISQFHEMFFEESFEGLETMENGLLNLQPGSSDIELINDIFRAAHSIKGGAGTFGFNGVSEFTHDLETLLDLMREGKFAVTTEAVEVMLQSVDCLVNMLTDLKEKRDVDYSASQAVSEQFKVLLNEPRDAVADTSPSSQSPDQEEDSASSSPSTAGDSNWHIEFKPYPEVLKTGHEPYRLIRELHELGHVEISVILDGLHAYDEMDLAECHLGWTIHLSGKDIGRDNIEEVFEWIEDEADLVIEQINTTEVIAEQPSVSVDAAVPSPASEVAVTAPEDLKASNDEPEKPALASVQKNDAKNQESKSIRVNIEKVDSLINMVGEMVITQSMLCQLSKEYSSDRHEDLVAGLAELESNTRELQETVMALRMMPISFAFNRFPRLVRDINRQLGKNVELVLDGEQTELDKTVMEKLGDPLTHLVRNAMDHGMELPHERVAKGKPEKGRLFLKAFYEGGAVVIQVGDDGGGLNANKIRAKAIDNGLITEEDELSKEDIQDLILRPGFSTADAVSDLSGRGVGLDVVRSNIRALSGTLEVQSKEDEGTTFTIRLPLTLAIVDGQLVRVAGNVYIIPLTAISESLQVETKNISTIAGSVDLYRLRDENIPVVPLDEIFGHGASTEREIPKMMVVVESNDRKMGIIVDELLDQQQVVIKSLGANYRAVEGLSGATILGDGTVALICDIHDVFGMSAGQYKQDFEKILNQNTNHAA